MSITRDQLRAARVLLHLQQRQLATLSKVSLSTIRRFEGGVGIGELHADALRRALVDAGVVFVDGDGSGGLPAGSVGVVLKPGEDLPGATRLRIAADGPQVGGGSGAPGSEPGGEEGEQGQGLGPRGAGAPATARPVTAPRTDDASAQVRPARKPRRGWPTPV